MHFAKIETTCLGLITGFEGSTIDKTAVVVVCSSLVDIVNVEDDIGVFVVWLNMLLMSLSLADVKYHQI